MYGRGEWNLRTILPNTFTLIIFQRLIKHSITAQVSLGKIRGSISHYPFDDTAQFPRIQRKFGLCTCSLLSDQISVAPRYELDLIGGTYVDWTPVTARQSPTMVAVNSIAISNSP